MALGEGGAETHPDPFAGGAQICARGKHLGAGIQHAGNWGAEVGVQVPGLDLSGGFGQVSELSDNELLLEKTLMQKKRPTKPKVCHTPWYNSAGWSNPWEEKESEKEYLGAPRGHSVVAPRICRTRSTWHSVIHSSQLKR